MVPWYSTISPTETSTSTSTNASSPQNSVQPSLSTDNETVSMKTGTESESDTKPYSETLIPPPEVKYVYYQTVNEPSWH